MEGQTCAFLNTCEESRQMKWIAWVWMKADRRTSCYEDSTFPSRLPSSAEVSTEPPRELEESCRDDQDINIDTGRVVCPPVRKILEKLKSLRSLRRLYVVSLEGGRRNSVINPGTLSTENEAGAQGIFDNTGQDSSEDASHFGTTKAGLIAGHRPSRTKWGQGEGKLMHPH